MRATPEQILAGVKLAIRALPAPTMRTFPDRISTLDLPRGCAAPSTRSRARSRAHARGHGVGRSRSSSGARRAGKPILRRRVGVAARGSSSAKRSLAKGFVSNGAAGPRSCSRPNLAPTRVSAPRARRQRSWRTPIQLSNKERGPNPTMGSRASHTMTTADDRTHATGPDEGPTRHMKGLTYRAPTE